MIVTQSPWRIVRMGEPTEEPISYVEVSVFYRYNMLDLWESHIIWLQVSEIVQMAKEIQEPFAGMGG